MLQPGYTLWRLFYLGAPIAILLVAFYRPRLGAPWFRRAERALDRIARRPGLAMAMVGLAALTISASLSLIVRAPQPRIHDEFSYLLAADTFAHGRLSNPTHPLWIHFESMHIIHQPTYASKYPPAQGLMLAAGQIIGGSPMAGAWLGVALACAALCWMLMAWTPPRWALVGGLLAATHPMILEWGQNYWGGAVAMGGGALLLGSWRRLIQRPRARDGWLMGAGIALLLNSRPYEGMVLCLLLLAALAVRMVKGRGPTAWVLLKRAAPPLLIVLALTAVAMGFYNLRVTGAAFRPAYLVHEATYAVAPPFLWQRPWPEPAYQNRELRDFYLGYARETYTAQRSVSGMVRKSIRKLRILAVATFRLWAIAIPLLALPWALRRDQWMRGALLICGAFTGALLLETWMLPHYAAPVIGLVFAFVLQAMRGLRLWRWRGRPVGLFIVRASLLLSALSLVDVGAQLSRIDANHAWAARRARILARLQSDGARHLVIVRYGPRHSPHQEWVYNEADIDRAPVVWAREMDAARNRQLLSYFADRRAWLLEADARDTELVPYPFPANSEVNHSTDALRLKN